MNSTEWLILTIAITQIFTLYLIYNLSCMFTKMVENQKDIEKNFVDIIKNVVNMLEKLNK